MTEEVRGSLRIAPVADEADRAWLADPWRAEWGGQTMATRGRLHRLADLDAPSAWNGAARVGAATFQFDAAGCELISLNATARGRGVGTALLATVEAARGAGAGQVWLITTNDNLDALRFYQRRGYHPPALYPGSVDAVRRAKPTVCTINSYDIPPRDELELAKHA